jgi:hypothetical protein
MTPTTADKTSLKLLLNALEGAANSLRMDGCGAWAITGRRGHITAWGDGATWGLYVACRSAQHWTWRVPASGDSRR